MLGQASWLSWLSQLVPYWCHSLCLTGVLVCLCTFPVCHSGGPDCLFYRDPRFPPPDSPCSIYFVVLPSTRTHSPTTLASCLVIYCCVPSLESNVPIYYCFFVNQVHRIFWKSKKKLIRVAGGRKGRSKVWLLLGVPRIHNLCKEIASVNSEEPQDV